MRRNFFCILSLVCSLFLSSCYVPSRTVFYGNGGRTSYNMAVQSTNAQEMLLNLVRMRYFDAPFFLDVGNVTTQYTYKALSSASIPIPGFDSKNPFVLGGEMSWQNQPTLQYSPVEGKKFARQIAQPIDLQTIQAMIYAGWNVKRIFRLVIQSFDALINAPMETNPNPFSEEYFKAFYEATELLRHFQLRGSLEIGIKVLNTKKVDDIEVKEEVLQIAFPATEPESERLAKLLGDTKKIGDRYIAQMFVGFQPKGRIGVMTRSVLSCMHYLSQGVIVPQEDVIKKKVNMLPNGEKEFIAWRTIIDSLMKIRWSSRKPQETYISVYYRKKWFYICDSDLTSKKTFALLQHLYNWQSGQEQTSVPPLLTLPLG